MRAASIRARVPVTIQRAGRHQAEIVTFDGLTDKAEHFALVVGAIRPEPLVRMHSECMTGDLFGSTRCDCGPQLDEAMDRITADGGILLYLRQEGRGIGLYNKIDAYAIQDQGVDTFRANELLGRGWDERDYTAGAQMLTALGITRVRLLTNNPDKVEQLTMHGIDIAEVEGTRVHLNPDNHDYLAAKAGRGGHRLPCLQPRDQLVAESDPEFGIGSLLAAKPKGDGAPLPAGAPGPRPARSDVQLRAGRPGGWQRAGLAAANRRAKNQAANYS
jgi:GTP cyclohydrolase II